MPRIDITVITIIICFSLCLVNGFLYNVASSNSLHFVQSKKLMHLPHLRIRTQINMAIVKPLRYTTSDWIESITTLPSSRILSRTKYNILFFSLWTTMWTYLHKIKKLDILQLPSSVHLLLASVLSLLLVFRTNSSYDRFWEGRKAWGCIIIACRNISRFTYRHIPRMYHLKVASLLVSFTITLKQHLQGERENSELVPFVTDSLELKDIQNKRNRPNYILRTLESLLLKGLKEFYEDPIEVAVRENQFLDSTMSLSSAVATCERIVKQPVPVSYARHSSRFLTFYMLSLPFALISTIGWFTIPVVTGICWSFVSILDIGQFIEDPFNKLTQVIPLNQIISMIRSDVSELLDEVLSGPEMDRLDDLLLQQLNANSRKKEKSLFTYTLDLVD